MAIGGKPRALRQARQQVLCSDESWRPQPGTIVLPSVAASQKGNRLLLATLTLLAVLTSPAYPQGAGGAAAVGDAYDPPFTIARLQYGGGGDWYVGPSTLPNLLGEIRRRTALPVAERPVTVRLTDPQLWRFPFLFMAGHGNIHFTDEEVRILREYLLSGGFLYADDCYGMDESFRREIRRVFPDKELSELRPGHPIYHAYYDLPEGLPKIHEHDGKPPQGFGIVHEGRLLVFYAYESDIHDGWEDVEVHNDPPQLREAAFRMGVNIFLYALAQAAR
jgi:hypothetical protein